MTCDSKKYWLSKNHALKRKYAHSLKRRGACVKYMERPTMVGEKQTESVILEVSPLQPSVLDHIP
jgi:hypothetical protein